MRTLAIFAAVIVAALVASTAHRWYLRSQWIVDGDTALNANLYAIAAQIAEFRRVSGRLPTTEEGLRALVEKPPDIEQWTQLLRALPLDPWSRPYHYRLAPDLPKGYDLYSLGPDPKKDADDTHLAQR